MPTLAEMGKQWKEALRLLQQMTSRALTPDEISYTAAISACEKSKQWEEALRMLQQMTCRALTPNEISYNAAISACEKGKQWEGSAAIAAADDVQGAYPQ